MDYVALHDVIRRQLQTGETAVAVSSPEDASSALSSGERSVLALLWQQVGQVGGDIDALVARVEVPDWVVPAGRVAER